MSSRRTLILIAAVLVGAIAAYSLYSYVQGIEDRANDNAERVQVFVIKGDIPKGMLGEEAFSQELIVEDEIPREFRPATAITSQEEISGKVAIANLATNQVVVGDLFVSPAEALTGFSDLLDPGDAEEGIPARVAVTISVDQTRGVAGLLVPGDFVNIMVTESGGALASDTPDGTPAQPGATDTPYKFQARVLFQKVQVLAVGQQRVLQPGETAATNPDGTLVANGSGLVTFTVPADAAQRISSLDPETIYLSLVPKEYVPAPLPAFDENEVLPAEDEDRLTPYGPTGPTGG